MSPKSQIHISSYFLAMMITICSAFVILTFYAPKFLVVWAEMGIELNLMQRLLVQSVNMAYWQVGRTHIRRTADVLEEHELRKVVEAMEILAAAFARKEPGS